MSTSNNSNQSLSQVIPEIDRIIQDLKTCDDYTTSKVYQYMQTIGSYVYQWKHAAELADYMKNAGFADVFPLMWNALYGSLEKLKDMGTSTQSLKFLLANCTNLSHHCPKLGIEFGKSGAISLLFQGLQHAVSNHTIVSQSEIFNYMSTLILQILHNSIRHSNHNRTLYRDCDAIPILKKCLSVSSTVWNLIALVILAYVANDSESGLLASSEQSIHVLTGILKAAVTKDTHKDNIGHSIFTVFELLDAINHLAINDGNKVAISKDNIIPVLVKILKEDEFSPEERRVAVEALWNLAFIDSIRTSQEMQNAIPTLKELLLTKDKDLTEACQSALFQIQGNQNGNDTTGDLASPPPSYQEAISEPNQTNPAQNKIQIMVSYQWDSQPRAIEIRDKLLDAGYQVWMDITNMRGNLLSGMAEAVQMSDIILLCMTESYKDSKNCRSEAAYAYKLEKNIIPLLLEEGYVPDGWLGLIQGMELYYAFYSDDHVRTNMGELLHAIKNCLGLPPEDEIDGEHGPITSSNQQSAESVPESGDTRHSKLKETPSEPSHQPTSRKPRPHVIRDWSNEDVKGWLRDNRVGDLCASLDFCDGKHLEMLFTQYQENGREPFKAELKSDYKISGPQCLQFMVALKSLFEDELRVTGSSNVAATNGPKSKTCLVL